MKNYIIFLGLLILSLSNSFAVISGSVPVFGGNGNISGTISSGYIPVASGPTSIVDSIIYNNGGNVGIGTSSPSEALEIAGNLHFSGTSRTITSDSAQNLNINSGNNLNLQADRYLDFKIISS